MNEDTYKDATLSFIANQLRDISGKIDKIDERLRLLEISVVQKEEIQELQKRVAVLEAAKIKLVAWFGAALVIIQFAAAYLMRKFGL